jgi:AcrR family transcriptional regulator
VVGSVDPNSPAGEDLVKRVRGLWTPFAAQVTGPSAALVDTKASLFGLLPLAAVGVTTPSIYLHFADKTELIWAVCEEHFRKLDEELERAAAGSDDPLESLTLRGRAYVRFGLDNAEGYRILFMSRGDLRPKEELLGEQAKPDAFANLVGAVERCMEAGAIRRDDPASVAFGLWALVHGLTSLLISLPHFPWPMGPEEMVDMLLANHFEGLRPRS